MKIAVPTDDGVRISRRFARAAAFVVADVRVGQVINRQLRVNPAGSRTRQRPARGRPRRMRDRCKLVTEMLSDCRAVIANAVSTRLREAMEREGIEVIVTSERLLDRALALFALAALQDESQRDPEEEEFELLSSQENQDEFDG